MKFIGLTLALLCAVAFTAAQQVQLEDVEESYTPDRVRRETDDKDRGSVVVRAEKPLSGPDRRPSLDLDYHQNLGNGASTYGGLNIRPGQPAQPHVGVQYERNFDNGNGFIRGHGQVQRGPGGRADPSFGLTGGWRFKREAEPQGSLVLEAQKPLSGPDRRPSVDLDYHQNFGNGASTYGGLNIRPGQPPQPHLGLQYEREFRNGFLRGHGQVQRGPGGRADPSFGLTGGWRFKREAEPQGSLVLEAQKPLSGPDRRPSVDLDYHQNFGNGASSYGGLNIRPGQPPQPHLGLQYEREFRNGFLRGHGQVQRGPGGRADPSFGLTGGWRFKREAEPQGSLVLEAQKPLSGPDRRPSVDLDYHQNFGNGASSYGGLNIRPGQPPQPHLGLQYEREFRNGFLRGHGQVQRGPGGRADPSFGLTGGWRFKREAEPQGSLVLQGQKPLSGPDRRPSIDLDYHQKFMNGQDQSASAYGGLNIRPGQPPQPHLGLQYERNFDHGNGFIRGHGQVQRGPGGGADPSFGITGGWRFRRDLDNVEQEQEEELEQELEQDQE